MAIVILRIVVLCYVPVINLHLSLNLELLASLGSLWEVVEVLSLGEGERRVSGELFFGLLCGVVGARYGRKVLSKLFA
jgi:hypothetical protein